LWERSLTATEKEDHNSDSVLQPTKEVTAMAVEDKALRHTIEREISKMAQGIDTSLMSVMVVNGVVYLGGRVKPWRGTAGRNIDVKKTILQITDALSSIRGVTQVVCDAAIEERV
jgi:osmotically-inducible protein OsmY